MSGAILVKLHNFGFAWSFIGVKFEKLPKEVQNRRSLVVVETNFIFCELHIIQLEVSQNVQGVVVNTFWVKRGFWTEVPR